MEFWHTHMADVTMVLPLGMVPVEARRAYMVKAIGEVWLMEQARDAFGGFWFRLHPLRKPYHQDLNSSIAQDERTYGGRSGRTIWTHQKIRIIDDHHDHYKLNHFLEKRNQSPVNCGGLANSLLYSILY